MFMRSENNNINVSLQLDSVWRSRLYFKYLTHPSPPWFCCPKKRKIHRPVSTGGSKSVFCVLCGLFFSWKVPFSPSSYCCYLFAARRTKAFTYFSGPSRAMSKASKEGVLLLLPDRNTDPVLPSRANVREQREKEREKVKKKYI